MPEKTLNRVEAERIFKEKNSAFGIARMVCGTFASIIIFSDHSTLSMHADQDKLIYFLREAENNASRSDKGTD